MYNRGYGTVFQSVERFTGTLYKMVSGGIGS